MTSQTKTTSLNNHKIEALRILKESGLTEKDLAHWHGNCDFEESHKNALIYLIHTHSMAPMDAIVEINELDPSQVFGISKGLTRNQVIGLNYYQIMALLKLQKYGLSAEALKSWSIYHDFEEGHLNALTYLIRVYGMKPLDAITEMTDLNGNQADGIAHGLTKNIVKNLSNDQLLTECKKNGFSEKDIKHFENNKKFGPGHRWALKYLIESQHIDPQKAIEKIKCLTNDEAWTILSSGYQPAHTDLIKTHNPKSKNDLP